jgi:hypothetical protein
MVVKEKRGRRRYILFRVSFPSRDKGSFISFVHQAAMSEGRPAPYVIQVRENLVILRCSPAEREDLISFMGRLGGESLLCSGTLRKLRRSHGL